MAELDLANKKAAVLRRLAPCQELVVAVSGGVDSAVLLALAVDALGPGQVLALTGRSGSLPRPDLDDAARVARDLGVRHVVLDTHEIRRPDYAANRGDRCFHCRFELFEVIEAYQQSREASVPVAYGAIQDDLGDVRPGMDAARSKGVLAPLLEAGITKQDIRALAADYELLVRDKPAGACLASRIPVGSAVTETRLRQVGQAESALRSLGFGQFRVRHHGEVARIESDPEGERLLGEGDVRQQVVAAVRQAGFRFIALDLEGYRTGSLNS